MLNHLPMNHRKYIIERFQILQQGEGLKGLFARLSQKNLLNIKAERLFLKLFMLNEIIDFVGKKLLQQLQVIV